MIQSKNGTKQQVMEVSYVVKINLRKSKVSYTIMIVSDNSDKSPKAYHIKAGFAGFLGSLAFVLFTALICFVVYNSVIAQGAVSRARLQQKKIEQLEEAYEQAAREKEGLVQRVSDLSESLNAEIEESQLIEAAEEQKRIPTGFPLDAAAALKETADEAQTGMLANQRRKEIVFTAAEGTNVVATAPGTVISIVPDEDFGNLISIDHGNGYISMYRNNSSAIIKESNTVDAGAVLFIVGNDNPEIGYSIRKDDIYVDPMDMLDMKG